MRLPTRNAYLNTRSTQDAEQLETPSQPAQGEHANLLLRGVRFEPTVPPKWGNGFRDRAVQPLRDPSEPPR